MRASWFSYGVPRAGLPGREKLYRHADQPEADRASPRSARHGLAGAEALEQVGEVVGVLLLLRRGRLHQPARRGVLVAEIEHHLLVAVDGAALGDQAFLDHVLERVALDVLGMAARSEALGREVRLAVELRDTCGDLVGVLLLVLRVLQELRRHALGVD